MDQLPAQRSASPVEREDVRYTLRAAVQRASDYVGDELAPRLQGIWERYDGLVAAEPAFYVGKDEAGNDVHHGSAVVIREVWDKVQAVIPDLARIFLGTNEVVSYTPKKPGDERFAEQATDYANHVLWTQNEGEQLLLDTLVLWLLKFAVLKVYWQSEEEESKHGFDGIDEQVMQALVQMMHDPNGSEIVGIDAQEEVQYIDVMAPTPDGGQMPAQQPMRTYSGTITRLSKGGRIVIELVPQDQFLIDPDAQKEMSAIFVGTDSRRMVSDVVALGVPFETVMEHAGGGDAGTAKSQQARLARRGRLTDGMRPSLGNDALEYVRVIEGVARLDTDGDGKAEPWRVLLLGDSPEPIDMVEGDDCYFIVGSPFRRPHEPIGTGLAESVADIQEQKTALVRGVINSMNRSNAPREVISETDHNAYHDLTSPIAGPIRTSSPGGIGFHVVPFTGDKMMPMLAYFDEVSSARTGVTMAGQGLDPDILKGQTVEGAKTITTAPQSRIEFLAREFAAGIMRPLFVAILKLACRYQDKKTVFRLRDQWVEVDPREWNAEMDADVRVGLGTGTRAEKLQALMVVKQAQEALLAQPSPLAAASLLVSVKEYRETLVQICELLGFKDASRFFKEVNDQDLQAHAQQQQQQQQQAIQTQVQIEQAKEQGKAQAQMPLEQFKAQTQAQLGQFKAQSDAQLAGVDAQLQERLAAMQSGHDMQVEQLKAQHASALQYSDQQFKQQMRAMEIEAEFRLAEMKMAHDEKTANMAANNGNIQSAGD